MYRHGSCGAESFAKDTSEDLERAWTQQGEKHGRIRRKAVFQNSKASYVPR